MESRVSQLFETAAPAELSEFQIHSNLFFYADLSVLISSIETSEKIERGQIWVESSSGSFSAATVLKIFPQLKKNFFSSLSKKFSPSLLVMKDFLVPRIKFG